MAQTKNSMSKLDRLSMLLDNLRKCRKECVRHSEEWLTYNDMIEKVSDMLYEEKRKAGYMAVYPIVNGSAQEALFEGTREQCKTYTDLLLGHDPSMKGNIIVLEL